MRRTSLLLLTLLAGCSFLSGYIITFTTQDEASVDPATSTLDFVVSAPALAYISAVECEGSKDLDLLPVLTDDMKVQTAFNLPLTALVGQLPGTECDVTVTAFDQTTTSNARATLSVVIAGEVATVDVSTETETSTETDVTEETPALEDSTMGTETEVQTQLEVETDATAQ